MSNQCLFAIFLIVSCAITSISGMCNVCNPNNHIACVNETAFRLCVGDEMISETMNCPLNKVCTRIGTGCEDEDMVKSQNAYGCNRENCQPCPTYDLGFVCKSRYTYKSCYNGNEYGELNYCASNNVCDIHNALEGKNPCVKECPLVAVCDAELEIPTTTMPTTTSNDPITTITTTSEEPITTTTTPTTLPSPSPNTDPTTTTTTTTTPAATTTTTQRTTTTTRQPVTVITTTRQPVIVITTSRPASTTTTTPASTTTTTPATTTTTPATTTTSTTTPEPPILNPTVDPIQQICGSNAAVGRYPHPNDPTCTKYVRCNLVNGAFVGNTVSCPSGSYFSNGSCSTIKPANCP